MSRARILADYVSSGDELAVTTATADAALPKAGGAMTGAITTNSTFDGVDIAARDAIHAPKASPEFTGVATAPSLVLTPGTAPGSPAEGQLYYNNADNVVKVYNGSAWEQLSNKFSATGGTITTSGAYKIHTFTSSGTFTAEAPGTVDYLVVAGGGGGGSQNGGGGGAGGFRTATGFSVTSQAYTITVGAGGATSTGQSVGNSGSDSVFSSITSTGGGGGAADDSYPGVNGGSGGGSIKNAVAGTGVAGQGNAGGQGGTSFGGSTQQHCGGGGGGAGAVGNNSSSGGGNGGAGTQSSIDGTNYYYSGGGGGATHPSGGGGTGGAGGGGGGTTLSGTGGAGGAGRNAGGSGSNSDGDAGSGGVNTGGGGGGGRGTTDLGGAGGSGIVIIRYAI